MDFFFFNCLLPLCWALGKSNGKFTKACQEMFLFGYSLLGLVDASPTGSGLGVSGACSTVRSLRSWGTRCGSHTLHSPGRCWELKVPSRLYGFVLRGGVYCARVSQSFLYISVWVIWVFYHLPVCRHCSASFKISCTENSLVCSYRWVCPISMGGGEFRRLLCLHLVLEPF